MTDESAQLIFDWRRRSLNEQDPFLKFFILYMCLDAWLVALTQKDRDVDKKTEMLKLGTPVELQWNSLVELPQAAVELIEIGKVGDLRPVRNGKEWPPKKLSRESKFKEFFDFIVLQLLYVLLCNDYSVVFSCQTD